MIARPGALVWALCSGVDAVPRGRAGLAKDEEGPPKSLGDVFPLLEVPRVGERALDMPGVFGRQEPVLGAYLARRRVSPVHWASLAWLVGAISPFRGTVGLSWSPNSGVRRAPAIPLRPRQSLCLRRRQHRRNHHGPMDCTVIEVGRFLVASGVGHSHPPECDMAPSIPGLKSEQIRP